MKLDSLDISVNNFTGNVRSTPVVPEMSFTCGYSYAKWASKCSYLEAIIESCLLLQMSSWLPASPGLTRLVVGFNKFNGSLSGEMPIPKKFYSRLLCRNMNLQLGREDDREVFLQHSSTYLEHLQLSIQQAWSQFLQNCNIFPGATPRQCRSDRSA